MIRANDLAKSFDGLRAVDGLSFSAMDGRVTGLIGPNGAGKTTTFRIVAGLLQADTGAADVDGFDSVDDRVEVHRRLGILPDIRGLYPRLTPREHLRYFGQLHGIEPDPLEARIELLAERLGMVEFLDRRARGFSRGQELKVALARSLIHNPRNLILDEPTNGLDVVSSRAVRHLIHEMRAAGHCILLSSHIMAEVSMLCDDLVVIARGRVAMSGTPDELRAATGREDLEDVFVEAVARAEGDALRRRVAAA